MKKNEDGKLKGVCLLSNMEQQMGKEKQMSNGHTAGRNVFLREGQGVKLTGGVGGVGGAVLMLTSLTKSPSSGPKAVFRLTTPRKIEDFVIERGSRQPIEFRRTKVIPELIGSGTNGGFVLITIRPPENFQRITDGQTNKKPDCPFAQYCTTGICLQDSNGCIPEKVRRAIQKDGITGSDIEGFHALMSAVIGPPGERSRVT